MEVIDTIFNLLHTKGEHRDFGWNEDALKFITQQVVKENPTMSVRAVKNWALWDIEVNDAELETLLSVGLRPTMVYASNLIWDRHGKFDLGASVHSKLITKITENIFMRDTKHSLYSGGPRHEKISHAKSHLLNSF